MLYNHALSLTWRWGGIEYDVVKRFVLEGKMTEIAYDVGGYAHGAFGALRSHLLGNDTFSLIEEYGIRAILIEPDGACSAGGVQYQLIQRISSIISGDYSAAQPLLPSVPPSVHGEPEG